MLFSRIKTYISTSPLAHIVIAAFIGGALPIIEPMIMNGKGFDVNVVKVAVYAGIAAVLRALVLAIPAK